MPENSRFYAGSLVVAGHGLGEVTATGERTRYGDIGRLVAQADTEPTPLQRKTARLVRWLVGGAAIVSVAVFAITLWQGKSPSQAFLYAITIAMSAVSEEFLLVISLFLSIGAWRLSRLGVLVRRLASVETLGSTTVICLDKTGTLTAGSYALQEHLPVRDDVPNPALLEAAALACEPRAADSLERAIIDHCRRHQVNVDELHSRWQLVHDYSFDMVGKHMSHVWVRTGSAEGDGRQACIVAKGALEGILEHCAIAPAEFRRAQAANAEMAAQGMRVLAVAGRFVPGAGPDSRVRAHGRSDFPAAGFTGVREEDERDLVLYGLLGFHDPLRREVPAAVAQCQAAGIRLKLITGDHALTAHAIAEAAGILHEDAEIATGSQLDEMTPERFREVALRSSIFARIRPEQKYAIVDALVRAGEVVAMTGDGINDAPALRRAHIGVAMGQRGTEVARAAADLVLLEDNFGALVATVREGRRIFTNIQHAFSYLIAFKFTIVGLALSAPLLGLPILLMPVDLVWLELIVHPVSALAFEGQREAGDVMRRPPRAPDAPFVAAMPALRSALCGALLTAAALGLYAARLERGENYARGAAMALVVVGSLILVWAELAGDRRWWKTPVPRAIRFWLILAAVAASLPILMNVAPLAQLLRIAPISATDWMLVAGLAIAAVAWRAFAPAASIAQARSLGTPKCGLLNFRNTLSTTMGIGSLVLAVDRVGAVQKGSRFRTIETMPMDYPPRLVRLAQRTLGAQEVVMEAAVGRVERVLLGVLEVEGANFPLRLSLRKETFNATCLKRRSESGERRLGWREAQTFMALISDEQAAKLTAMGVREIFAPGSSSEDSIKWVREHVGSPQQPARRAEPGSE